MLDWIELEQACESCSRCPLREGRNRLVFGVGDRSSAIVFVGEGPGESEDAQGEPFVGRAGKLYDRMLNSVGLDRSEVYTANIVKCRPPHNRDPLPEERDACFPWLENQLWLIKPKLLVCLGRIAAMRFIKPDFKITAEHGQWFDYKGIKTTAVFHPAALLRDPRRLGDQFEDMRKIEIALAEAKSAD